MPRTVFQEGASTEEKILAAAAENNTLLQTLEETAHASQALREKNSEIASLQNQLSERQSHANSLASTREKEHKHLQKYRDSTVLRISYNLAAKSGSFSEKLAQAERAYLETTERYNSTVHDVQSIETKLAEARESRTELDSQCKKHEHALKTLDTLYDAVFEGLPPTFPKESEAGSALAEARWEWEKLQANLEHEKQVLKLIEEADVARNTAGVSLKKAARVVETALYLTGHNHGAFKEKQMLARARDDIQKMQDLMRQAQEMSGGKVGRLPSLKLPNTLDRSNPWANNYWDVKSQLTRISSGVSEVERAGLVVREEKVRAKGRVWGLESPVQQASEQLEENTWKLREVRRMLFEQVAGGLPEYKP
ncbi:hypothetical protein FQN50_000353 [Emmonsiellopsis sp. PD_5]|nr:hypothetical protein FQN50_000353 [Emmonsiellopsis sp. PD_5]